MARKALVSNDRVGLPVQRRVDVAGAARKEFALVREFVVERAGCGRSLVNVWFLISGGGG